MNLTTNNNKTADIRPSRLGDLLTQAKLAAPGELAEIQITGLAVDSRKVKPGDLFFAVPGFVTDGARFIAEAVSLGARAVVTESTEISLTDIPIIRCQNIRQAMSAIAAPFFDHPSRQMKVIGVTGTNGKTTVTYMIGHIMRHFGKNWGRIGTVEYYTGKRTVNALNTTPDSIEIQRLLAEMRDCDLKGCVMEVSSHGLDQHRCDDIEFSGAVFTNLTQDHLDYHENLDNYFQAKATLFVRLLKNDGIAAINIDDQFGEKLRQLSHGKIITYSTSDKTDPKTTVKIFDDGYKNGYRHFRVIHRDGEYRGSLPLMGRFNLANAGAALAVAVGLGYQMADAVKALNSAPQVPGRVEIIRAGQPFQVIIDYAHTPDALQNLLTGVDSNGRKILVFGCGGDRDRTKRPIMGEIAVTYADQVFVTSDNPRTEEPGKIINDILKGIPAGTNYTANEKRDEAIKEALFSARAGDLVIIAGKGHENYQIVGNTRHYFSDPEVVKRYLRKMGYEGS